MNNINRSIQSFYFVVEAGLVNHCVQAGSAYQKALDIAHEIIKQVKTALVPYFQLQM